MEQRALIVSRNDRLGNRIIALPGLGWETKPGNPNAGDADLPLLGGEASEVA